MPKIDISFTEVRLGEKFISYRGKRCFGGIRIKETMILHDGFSIKVNSVILTDHQGELTHDVGVLVAVSEEEVVQVRRNDHVNITSQLADILEGVSEVKKKIFN
jgi:hypothetical protein